MAWMCWTTCSTAVIKSLVFGVTVTLVALYEGWQARPTPEGVGRATTRTVVVGSLAVLGLDFILTALMFGAIDTGSSCHEKKPISG